MVGLLLSSTGAARALGVSSSTLKRWADQGLVDCVRTAGHHRRFAPEAIHRLQLRQRGDDGAVDARSRAAVSRLAVEDLVAATATARSIEARLLGERERLGSWSQVAASLGPLLVELGERWSRGGVSILEEHLASERLARALARLGEWLPSSAEAPRALLATVEDEEHTLGLSLVELCLRERGWTTLWSGRRTPMREIAARVARGGVRAVLLSASLRSNDETTLAAQLEGLSPACVRSGTDLLVGGSGAWPAAPRGAHLVRDLTRFGPLLDLLARAPPRALRRR